MINRESSEQGSLFWIGRGEVWGSACEWQIEYWLQVSEDRGYWTILRKGEGEDEVADTDDVYAADEIREVVEQELGLYEPLTDEDWVTMGLADPVDACV